MNDRSSPSLPVATLTILGILICVLGLFAAGDLVIAAVGLAAVLAAGILEVVAQVSANRAATERDRLSAKQMDSGAADAPQAPS